MYRKADWALSTYVVLSAVDRPDKRMWRSTAGQVNYAVHDALHDLHPPEGWGVTLVGGAVHAVGIAERIEE